MKPALRTAARLAPLLGVRLIAMGLVFVQTLVMTRVFKAEVFGLFSFAQTVVVIAALCAAFGFDKLLMRTVAATGLDNVAADRGWARTLTLCLKMSAALAAALTVAGLAVFGLAGLGGIYAAVLLAATVAMPFLLIRQFSEGLILGAKRTLRAITGSQIVFPAMMIAGAGAVVLSGAPRGAGAVSMVYVAAMALSAGASLLLLRPLLPRLRPARPSSAGNVPTDRAIVISGGSFGLVAAGFVIGPHMDVLLLGLMAGPEDVALVRVAARIGEMIGLVRAVVMLQYAPLLAEAFGRGDDARLRKLVRELGLIFIVTGTPLFLGFMVFAEEAMGMFGEDFVAGAPVMRIYLIGVFFTMLAGPGSSLLSMCGHETMSARILWIALSVNLALDLALIPFYGALGCAIANMASLIVLGLAAAIMARRRTGIQPWALLPRARPGAGS